MTNAGGGRVSRFRATLTDGERDSQPLINAQIDAPEEPRLQILVYSRSAPLAAANDVLYIHGGFIFTPLEFVKNGAVLGETWDAARQSRFTVR